MGNCTSSGGGGGAGGIRSLVAKANAETNENRVLNAVPHDKLGTNFQNLSYSEKSAITSMLRLTKNDVLYLNDYQGRGSQSQSIRIDGSKYTTSISVENGKIVYSLNKGRKSIVKNGTYQNVANQLAMLMKKR